MSKSSSRTARGKILQGIIESDASRILAGKGQGNKKSEKWLVASGKGRRFKGDARLIKNSELRIMNFGRGKWLDLVIATTCEGNVDSGEVSSSRCSNVFFCRLSVFVEREKFSAGAREIFVSRGKSRVRWWEIPDRISGWRG